jgi:hypothetical protein
VAIVGRLGQRARHQRGQRLVDRLAAAAGHQRRRGLVDVALQHVEQLADERRRAR